MLELISHNFLLSNEYLLQSRPLLVPLAYRTFTPASRDTTASVGTQDIVQGSNNDIRIHTTSWGDYNARSATFLVVESVKAMSRG